MIKQNEYYSDMKRKLEKIIGCNLHRQHGDYNWGIFRREDNYRFIHFSVMPLRTKFNTNLMIQKEFEGYYINIMNVPELDL